MFLLFIVSVLQCFRAGYLPSLFPPSFPIRSFPSSLSPRSLAVSPPSLPSLPLSLPLPLAPYLHAFLPHSPLSHPSHPLPPMPPSLANSFHPVRVSLLPLPSAPVSLHHSLSSPPSASSLAPHPSFPPRSPTPLLRASRDMWPSVTSPWRAPMNFVDACTILAFFFGCAKFRFSTGHEHARGATLNLVTGT